MTQNTRKKEWWEGFWPKVTSIEGARSAAMLAFWGAIFSAAFTALFAILSMFGTQLAAGLDAYAIVDAVVVLLLAWGIWKMSRTAAVIMLVYFLGAKAFLIMQNGIGNPLMAILFTILFVNGMRGTFAYHRLTRGKAQAVTAQA